MTFQKKKEKKNVLTHTHHLFTAPDIIIIRCITGAFTTWMNGKRSDYCCYDDDVLVIKV